METLKPKRTLKKVQIVMKDSCKVDGSDEDTAKTTNLLLCRGEPGSRNIRH